MMPSPRNGHSNGHSRPVWHMALVFFMGFMSAHGIDMIFQIDSSVKMLSAAGISMSNENSYNNLKNNQECDCSEEVKRFGGAAAVAQMKTERVEEEPLEEEPPSEDDSDPETTTTTATRKRKKKNKPSFSKAVVPTLTYAPTTTNSHTFPPGATGFSKIVSTVYERAIVETVSTEPRKRFDVNYWERESGLTTLGGLTRQDRILLGQLYYNASSVFEYGLGESTYLANHVGVERYAGIDSDPVWVGMARDKVQHHFRFYLGDIGATKEWGYPVSPGLAKGVLDYQLAPLIVEPLPFDVYMVDGRFRVACMIASFLHASARGADPSKTIVLIHDCPPVVGGTFATQRDYYKQADHLLTMINHPGDQGLLCTYQRKQETTDQQLTEFWLTVMDDNKRRRTRRRLQNVADSSATGFDTIVAVARERALVETKSVTPRKILDIDFWENESGLTTEGGLDTEDRKLLGQIYGNAQSVFEYGLGESTYMANYVGVERFAGIDSDPEWVAMARAKVSSHFRFYLGDIGPTKAWGFPTQKNLAKQLLDYQIAPLIIESKPFDVYMVDGRWRLPTMIACFLHASDRGADPSLTTVLLHDCAKSAGGGDRALYKSADHLLDLDTHSGSQLCVYKRKPETTDAQLQEFWLENMDKVKR